MTSWSSLDHSRLPGQFHAQGYVWPLAYPIKGVNRHQCFFFFFNWKRLSASPSVRIVSQFLAFQSKTNLNYFHQPRHLQNCMAMQIYQKNVRCEKENTWCITQLNIIIYKTDLCSRLLLRGRLHRSYRLHHLQQIKNTVSLFTKQSRLPFSLIIMCHTNESLQREKGTWT